MFKLGTDVKDSVTGLKGMLTHARLEGDTLLYIFQPRALNPKTREPVEGFYIDKNRVVNGIDAPEPYLAREVLGSQVEDRASGYNGIAIASVLHINGCVHLEIQAQGVAPETFEKIKRQNIDIRQLKGKAIKQMTESEVVQSHTTTPSPMKMPARRD